MSKLYCEVTGKKAKATRTIAMRQYCQRPGKIDEHGKIAYTTEQAHQKECDIEHILNKYKATGLIQHVSRFESKFGDQTGLDFKEAMDLVTGAKKAFEGLPVHIKKRFGQDPGKLLKFMENPENRAEAIQLGLIDPDWTDATDGLGEHVPEGQNVNQSDDNPENT